MDFTVKTGKGGVDTGWASLRKKVLINAQNMKKT